MSIRQNLQLICWIAFGLAVIAVVALYVKNAHPYISYSLGTNGTLSVKFDSEKRVSAMRQYYPDGRLKLKVEVTYSGRDINRFRVLDSSGHKMVEDVFSADKHSSKGRDSEIPSPGWDIRYEQSWSGMPGDVFRLTSWFCNDELLYRQRQIWTDNRNRVFYEVTGPSGVILFTNTYSGK